MDIKIENYDILLNDNGSPVMIQGIEQAIQQLNTAVTVRKGSFIYDREMGFDILKNVFGESNAVNTVETLIYESLIRVPDITVEVKNIENRDGRIYADITVSDGYQTEKTEVIVYG